MSVYESIAIHVSQHAMWRAAERFPRFDILFIEKEVREALAAGRVSSERAHLGLSSGADPTCVYVWTEDGERIYALRSDDESFYVTTTMDRRK